MTARATREQAIEAALRDLTSDVIDAVAMGDAKPSAPLRVMLEAARRALALPPDAPQEAGEFAGHTPGVRLHDATTARLWAEKRKLMGDDTGWAVLTRLANQVERLTERAEAREEDLLTTKANNRALATNKAAMLSEISDWKRREQEERHRACVAEAEVARLRVVECPDCSGRGWYEGHDYNGEPEQTQCERCLTTGKLDATLLLRQRDAAREEVLVLLAERDALRAEVAELREALDLVANDTTNADLRQEVEFLKAEHANEVEQLREALSDAREAIARARQ